jgi:carbon-monoxide dehydrogenase small subunit
MGKEEITLTVNGTTHTFSVENRERLLDVLRNRLDLTGAKNGCGYGKCGSCTVVMNGEAVTSCTVLARKADGTTVITIEGLTREGKLHPIQEAMIAADAVQCGFCTPGIVMGLYALFTKDISASEEEIRKVLSKHLCRCTGYEAIWEGALLAQKKLQALGSKG